MKFLYGRVPSGFLVCFYSLVFTLSKGKLIPAAIVPEMKLESAQTVFGLFPRYLVNLSLDSSYDTSIPKLRDIALTTVGVAPFQQLKSPSSLMILDVASKKFL